MRLSVAGSKVARGCTSTTLVARRPLKVRLDDAASVWLVKVAAFLKVASTVASRFEDAPGPGFALALSMFAQMGPSASALLDFERERQRRAFYSPLEPRGADRGFGDF